MNGDAILVAGGYGFVGAASPQSWRPTIRAAWSSPAATTSEQTRRRRQSATACAAACSTVTEPSSIAAALGDVALVVSCIDEPQRGLLHAAIERGLRYTDIAPHLTELGRGAAYEEIDAAAQASGAHVLLGAGLVPGISNVIVRALPNELGAADTIETSLLLSAGDATGPASFEYFLQELTMPFDVHVDDADRPARAFS